MLTSAGISRCARCGAPVRIAITAHNRQQALNPDPDPDGNTAAFHDGTGTLRARGLTRERPTVEHAEWLARPHISTCKNPPGPRRNSGSPQRRRSGVRPPRWQGWTR